MNRIKTLQELNLLDRFLFSEVMADNEILEDVLEIILYRPVPLKDKAQAEKELEEIAFDEYSEVLFISKSVGTIIASAYAEKYKIKCCQILYTPLEQTFMFEHDDAIAFIGTADPWSDVKKVIACSKNQAVPIYVYEDANHSLEKENILQNIDILKNVMEKTQKYLR